ncbi:E3 ubiquitin- ligase UBR5, partial [Brachionus plicatilis]
HDNDNLPLFWQPDKKSANRFQYSPVVGKCSPCRLNAFRNVGRVIAVCLLQNELCPITLSRHVIKYILGRPVRWHDLAFYDSQMYESFRKMIADAEQFLSAAIEHGLANSKTGSDKAVKDVIEQAIAQCNEQVFGALDFTFNIDLPSEESPLTNVDLVENGSGVQLTCVNMYEFVKLYAEYRMVKSAEPCLKEMRAGVFDVLPANALHGLYAEDLRLLLNGVADINVHVLASYTTISDESKESAKRAHFEKWFWSTLHKMSQQDKQELLFFWTGSPYLPASDDGFQPLPTITLRPPSDQLLPTANTCINRLYVPIYSSKSILKSKLLLAIKTKTFGFFNLELTTAKKKEKIERKKNEEN